MPRNNQGRRRSEERDLARRMAYERDKRGWSNPELAKRMTSVGCPIDPSALYKIERGKPKPRKVEVDELAAMSIVFEIPVGELMRPPEQALGQRARELVEQLHKDRQDALRAVRRINEAVKELLTLPESRRISPQDLETADRAESALLHLIDLALEIERELLPDPSAATGGE